MKLAVRLITVIFIVLGITAFFLNSATAKTAYGVRVRNTINKHLSAVGPRGVEGLPSHGLNLPNSDDSAVTPNSGTGGGPVPNNEPGTGGGYVPIPKNQGDKTLLSPESSITPSKTLDEILIDLTSYAVSIALALAGLAIIYAAYQMLFAGGDPAQFQKGVKTIRYTIIAVFVILLSKALILLIQEIIVG